MRTIQILWADDEIELLKPHLIFLEKKGYQIDTVTNGVDAIEKVNESFYDLIFLDENMPGLSGLDVLKDIKETKPDLPVIMVTKSEEEHIMEDAIGSQIEDYLIKPVNPSQMLLSIKKTLDNKRLVAEKVTSGYQQDFRNIGMAFFEKQSFEQWTEIYKKLVYWDMQMGENEESGMEEVLQTQFLDANREFSKFVEDNYQRFISYENKEAPVMSHTLMRSKVVPYYQKSEQPVFFLLVDNMRFDQWRIMQTVINERFRTTEESMYLSILPTTTQYCRNAVFAGLMPNDIERRFPKKWMNDEDEGGKNMAEYDYLQDLFQRLRVDGKTSYNKIVNQNQGRDLPAKIPNLFENDFNVIVYNFVDSMSHARTDDKVMRELAEDEAAYRSLTKSWFAHSHLWDAMKEIADRGGKIIMTTDHGSVRVKDPLKIIGDKKTTTNLRYKTGKNLSHNNKQIFEIKDPEKFGLPRQHMSSTFAFAKEQGFFVYPNNLNHYAKYYKDTFQHGGISIEEMMVPYIELSPK